MEGEHVTNALRVNGGGGRDGVGNGGGGGGCDSFVVCTLVGRARCTHIFSTVMSHETPNARVFASLFQK